MSDVMLLALRTVITARRLAALIYHNFYPPVPSRPAANFISLSGRCSWLHSVRSLRRSHSSTFRVVSQRRHHKQAQHIAPRRIILV